MAVRYAENLTLFKSATGREGEREMKGKQLKMEDGDQKTQCNRNLPAGQHKQDLHLHRNPTSVSYCQWTQLRGERTNV